MKERNLIYKLIGKIVSTVAGIAILFVLGVAIASWVKDSTFTIEFNNMIAWFLSWAK